MSSQRTIRVELTLDVDTVGLSTAEIKQRIKSLNSHSNALATFVKHFVEFHFDRSSLPSDVDFSLLPVTIKQLRVNNGQSNKPKQNPPTNVQ